MNRTTFNITAKRPTEEESEKLKKTPNGKKPLTRVEKLKIWKDIFTYLAIGTLSFFIGKWLLGGRDASSIKSLGSLLGFVILFTLKWILPSIMLIALLFVFPGSAQKKTVEGAMNWVFIKSLFANEGYGIHNFGSSDFAAAKYARIAPDALNLPYQQIFDYVVKFRKFVEEAVEKEPGTKDWTSPDVNLTIASSTELFPDVVEVSATLMFGANANFETGRGKQKFRVSEVVLNITYVLVKSGGFWYPYDMFPQITAPLP